MSLLKAFEIALTHTCGCALDSRFLLAVSGGIDSVTMADVFHRLGCRFDLAHCNFSLRGAASDGDQAFVERLAVTQGVACHVISFDTMQYASKHGISLQMAARALRYAWFAELAATGYDAVAIAHNRDDDVETLLLNLARGCGLRGLTGMQARQEKVIRPLLFATRSEIQDYASLRKLEWREDASNVSDKYLRNRIRHHVVPELEAVNPAFQQHAADLMHRLFQTEKLFRMFIDQVRSLHCVRQTDRFLIDIEAIRAYPSQETLLYELLREFGCTDLHIGPILESFSATPGKRFYTRTHCITRDRTHLLVTPVKILTDGEWLIDADTRAISYPLNMRFRGFQADTYSISRTPSVASMDAACLEYPLKLRRWQQGDRFQPFGFSGHKKISDFLINSKIPLPDKEHTWVLESGGNIVWLVGHRIDDRVKITPHTKQIVQIECLTPDEADTGFPLRDIPKKHTHGKTESY
jgi:tRNA(Ile)-lysidine synthase